MCSMHGVEWSVRKVLLKHAWEGIHFIIVFKVSVKWHLLYTFVADI